MVEPNGTKSHRKSGREYETRDIELRMTTSARDAPVLRYAGSREDTRVYDLIDTIRFGFGVTSFY